MNMKLIAAVALTAALIASCDKKNGGSAESKDPSAPTGVVLVQGSETETSLTFKWDEAPGATSYSWKLMKGSEEVQTGGGTTRSARITGLTPGTTYKFYVRSVWGGGESDWSAPVEASTKESGGGGGGDDPVPVEVYQQFMVPEAEDVAAEALAFPGAEGGGMFTSGGRGGKVLHVTTLEDNTREGSLRWACTQNYPRIIVFDVAGIIALNSTLIVNRPDCTIAGQTAPGDGICLKNYTFRIAASNVIVRFIRCRMGDEKQTEDDAMQVMDHDNDKYENIIIDHCSVSWCTDECASFYGMKNFSFQWNIVSESLRNSVHGKGAHGYGGIWGGTNATYHHNLLAHHDSRNPRIDHDYVSTQKGPVSIVNNVIYNWKGNSCYGGESASATGDYKKYNIIGNYYKPGPVTPSNHIWFLDPTTSCSNCTTGDFAGSSVVPGRFYMTGNTMDGKSSMTSDNWTGTTAGSSTISTIKATSPFVYSGVQPSVSLHEASSTLLNAVTGYAGASSSRDDVDTRVCSETKNGTYTYHGSATTDKNGNPLSEDKLSKNGLIDTQTDVGGWPEYKATQAEVDHNRDSDADGMPDWFEDQFGLQKSQPADALSKNLDIKGRYTNVEMYLHYLVREIVASGNEGAVYQTM